MNTKKIICILTAAICVTSAVSLSACGNVDEIPGGEAEIPANNFYNANSSDSTDSDDSTNSDTEPSSEENSTDDAETAEEVNIDVEQELLQLNSAAKSAYNCAADLIADQQILGYPMEKTLADGYFAHTSSAEGMEIGFDKVYESDGDSSINYLLSTEYDGSIIVYLGLTKINGDPLLFVQTRDAAHDNMIGQYPDAIQSSELDAVSWTEFHIRNTDYGYTAGNTDKSSNDIETLNYAAKEGYNAVAEALASNEYYGISIVQTFKEEFFAQSNSPDGLVIGLDAAPQATGDILLNELLAGSYDDIAIYVGFRETDEGVDFFVQARDLNNSAFIGQYPSPASAEGEAAWGVCPDR